MLPNIADIYKSVSMGLTRIKDNFNSLQNTQPIAQMTFGQNMKY